MGKKQATEVPQAIRSRIVGEGVEAPDQLLANPMNWRRHPKEQLDALEGVLSTVGWVQRVIVNRTTGHMVDGHARVELALRRNEPEVPVLYVELTADEERVVLAALDPIGGMATTDQAMLDDLLAGVVTGNEALDAMLAGMVTEPVTDGLTDPDDTPPVPADPISRLGDVWLLGRHRIVCGDCTDAQVVEKALNGVKPHLMVTDPPYGVEYDPAVARKASKGSARGTVLNDDRSDWSASWTLFPGSVAYVWHAMRTSGTVFGSLAQCGFEVRSEIVWDKGRLVMGRGHYHPQHESCWYAVRETASWSGGSKQSTVWQIQHLKSDTGHGTQKPVECMRRPIENNSSVGQAVYEPFSGSGTTIIAAEMTGRVCHAIELSPAYVDVAVKRWQAFTGKTATLESDGRTFDEVAAEMVAESA